MRYNLANADDFNCEGTTKQTNKIINIRTHHLEALNSQIVSSNFKNGNFWEKIRNDALTIANQLLDRATADAMKKNMNIPREVKSLGSARIKSVLKVKS